MNPTNLYNDPNPANFEWNALDGTVNPAQLNSGGPSPTIIDWNDFDVFENPEYSLASGAGFEQPPFARPAPNVEGVVKSWHKGSIASNEEYFDSKKAALPAEHTSLGLNEGLTLEDTAAQKHAPSRHDPFSYPSTPIHQSSELFSAPPQVGLQDASSESGDCLRCDRPDDFDHMVQCDNTSKHGANKGWFHYSCVGLPTSTTLNENESWYCEACQATTPSPGSPGSDDYVASTDDDNKSVGDYTYEDNKKSSKQGRIVHSRSGKTGTPASLLPNNDGYQVTKKAQKPQAEKATSSHKVSSKKTSPAKPNKAGSRAKAIPWNQHEKNAAMTVMGEIVTKQVPGYKTETRWQIASDRMLERFNVSRTGPMVKNYWNREGRRDSGVDERNKPDPDRMVTGVQDPGKRREARKAKGKDQRSASAIASKEKNSSGGVKRKGRDDDEAEDSDNEPLLRKRQKRQLAPPPKTDQQEGIGSSHFKRTGRDDDEDDDSDEEPLLRKGQKSRPAPAPQCVHQAGSASHDLKRKGRDHNNDDDEESDDEPILRKRQKNRPAPAPESDYQAGKGSHDLKRKGRDDNNDEDEESDDEPLVRKRQRKRQRRDATLDE